MQMVIATRKRRFWRARDMGEFYQMQSGQVLIVRAGADFRFRDGEFFIAIR
jgi:hypothetical protein